MTKKDTIDYFRALLPRIDKTGKYHAEIVAHTIERAVNNVLCDLFLRFPELIDPYMKEYLGSEYSTLYTTEDANTGLWYAELPVSYVPLPVVGSGVREVALEEDSTLTFVPDRYDDIMRSKDFVSQDITTMISYAVVGKKLIFSNMPAASDGESLRVRVVTSFTDYAATDDFIIPYGQDIAVVQNVYQILGLIRPIDLYTNNSDSGRGQ